MRAAIDRASPGGSAHNSPKNRDAARDPPDPAIAQAAQGGAWHQKEDPCSHSTMARTPLAAPDGSGGRSPRA
ncbi:hypothetical protein C5E43_28535 [Nocardia cyriacigeorgica]|nr:hypothetical protein C5B73_28160 [Nocardia cyriacigeorgica]PPJ01443.1 hypothetical protein C5E43_28535 [Nocardia cyriacigeorgica]